MFELIEITIIMGYSLEIPVCVLLQRDVVLSLVVQDVMKFLPPVGATSHFNTVSQFRHRTLIAAGDTYSTPYAALIEETHLYDWLRDTNYWTYVENHSVFGYGMTEDLRRHVHMMIRAMRSYVAYRGLSAPSHTNFVEFMNGKRKRFLSSNTNRTANVRGLQMIYWTNVELVRMFCQGPWPKYYVDKIRGVVIDEVFTTIKMSLRRDGDVASIQDVNQLYKAVTSGLRWHQGVRTLVPGRRLTDEFDRSVFALHYGI